MDKESHSKPKWKILISVVSRFTQEILLQKHPIYKSHPPYTGKDLEVCIRMEDVILVEKEKTFLDNGFLTTWAKNFIINNIWVKQSIQDFKDEEDISI